MLAGAPVAVVVLVATVACTSPAGAWTVTEPPAKGAETGSVPTRWQRLDCSSATSCIAVGALERDGALVAARWDGASWERAPEPPVGAAPLQPSAQVASLFDCASPLWCALFPTRADTGTFAVWTGAGWTAGSTATPRAMDSLSCPAVNTCYALASPDGTVGDDRLLYRWDGAAWSPVTDSPVLPRAGSLADRSTLSCPAVDSCIVLTRLPQSTGTTVQRWHGAVWAAVPMTDQSAKLTDVDCPSENWCAFGGFDQKVATWQGVSVDVTTLGPDGDSNLSNLAVGCAGPGSCLVHSRRWTAQLEATTWWPLRRPGATGTSTYAPEGDVDCASPTLCFLAGFLASPADGVGRWDGSSWVDAALPSRSADPVTSALLSNVSCPTADACVAVGSYRDGDRSRVLAMSWDGVSWTLLPDPPVDIGDQYERVLIDCADAGTCVVATAVDPPAAVGLLAWDGTTWTVHRPSSVPATASATVDDISCADSHWCLATGTAGIDGTVSGWAELWDGARWSTIPAPAVVNRDGPPSSERLSCVSPAYCMHLTPYPLDPFADTPPALAPNVVQIWDGATWTAGTVTPPPRTVGGTFVLADIDCPAVSACVGVGMAGSTLTPQSGRALAMRWDGRTWTSNTLSTISTRNGTASIPLYVSCASTTHCVALQHSLTEPPRVAVEMTWSTTGLASTQLTLPATGSAPTDIMALSCAGDRCMLVGRRLEAQASLPVAYRYRGRGR